MKNQNKLITKQTTVWVKVDSEFEAKHLFSDMALRYDYIGTELDRVKIFIHDAPTSEARKWKINLAELDTSKSGEVTQTVLNEALAILGILNKLKIHGSCGYPWSKASSDAKAAYIAKTEAIGRELMHECNLLANQSGPYHDTEFAYERLDRLSLDRLASEFSLDEIEYVKVKQSIHDHTKLVFGKSPEKLMKEKMKRIAENSRYGAYGNKHIMEEVYEIAYALEIAINKILAGPAYIMSYSDYKRLMARLSEANGAIMHDSALAIAANDLLAKINKLVDAFIENNEPDQWLHERVCDLLNGDEAKDLRWKIGAICKYHTSIMQIKDSEKKKEQEAAPEISISSCASALHETQRIVTALNAILALENKETYEKDMKISSLKVTCDVFISACKHADNLYSVYAAEKLDAGLKTLLNDICEEIKKILNAKGKTDEDKLAKILKVLKSDEMLIARMVLTNVENFTDKHVMDTVDGLIDKLRR